ncbi:hypothetical protein V8G54_037725 [Vigna mungo]|uniref:Protein kinase domain-containing protein n=1 Tax=Vigna mungo TaxID=3915 RepID=A0AAQ3MJP5_VIGMU
MASLLLLICGVMLALNNNLNPQGWTGPDPCKWDHVKCSEDKRVTRIQISRLNLQDKSSMSPQGSVRVSMSPQSSIGLLPMEEERERSFYIYEEKDSHVLDVVFPVIGAVFVVSIIGFLIFRQFRMKQKLSMLQNSVGVGGVSEARNKLNSEAGDIQMVEAGKMVISIEVMRNATDNFNEKNILGKGGFGTVYKGELHDGYCLDGNGKLLVYELMPQGTLSRHLFNWLEEGLEPLEWNTRLMIALDVARGKEKPLETNIAGTYGYLAPEYAVIGRVTTKVDVFSFGVILMELITGRKALDKTQSEDSMLLATWFCRMSINKDSFHKTIDSTIDLNEETLASIHTVAELAGHCCAREPDQRPDMGHIVNVLSSLVEFWKPSDQNSEDIYDIDHDMSLSQALKKWKAKGKSIMESSSSYSLLPSLDNTDT